jgi:hypothetical protein
MHALSDCLGRVTLTSASRLDLRRCHCCVRVAHMPSLLETAMLAVPPRTADKVFFAPSLRLYIQTAYQEDAAKFEADLASLDGLRDEVRTAASADCFTKCAPHPRVDAHADGSAGVCAGGADAWGEHRYLFHLQSVTVKFPFNDRGVRLLPPHPYPQHTHIHTHTHHSGVCVAGRLTASARATQVRMQFVWTDAFRRKNKRTWARISLWAHRQLGA